MNTLPQPKPPVMPLFSATHLRAALPPEMQALPQWVLWRYEERDGRWTKIPLYPTKHGLRMAKSNDPRTWVGLEEALDAAEKHGVGLGFCFGSKDGLVGYDLDKIEENGGEEIASWFLSAFGEKAYIETSPSGKGLRLFCKGSLPRAGKGSFARLVKGRFCFCSYHERLPASEDRKKYLIDNNSASMLYLYDKRKSLLQPPPKTSIIWRIA